jgi:hypothetical protein
VQFIKFFFFFPGTTSPTLSLVGFLRFLRQFWPIVRFPPYFRADVVYGVLLGFLASNEALGTVKRLALALFVTLKGYIAHGDIGSWVLGGSLFLEIEGRQSGCGSLVVKGYVDCARCVALNFKYK